MMKKTSFRVLTLLVALLLVSACSPRARYEHRLKKELASGVRHDSLFLGLYLGMHSKDFFIHCWKLNQQGLIRQGPNNQTVEYKIKEELKYPATMLYYPQFFEDKIYEMPVRISYDGWTPWNKELSSDNLLKDVLHWFEKKYGRGFIKVVHPDHGPAYVKIDGNRRITIFKENDLYVWAVFTDMSVKKSSGSFLPGTGDLGDAGNENKK